MAFLRGKDPSLAHRIGTRSFCPEGPSFATLEVWRSARAWLRPAGVSGLGQATGNTVSGRCGQCHHGDRRRRFHGLTLRRAAGRPRLRAPGRQAGAEAVPDRPRAAGALGAGPGSAPSGPSVSDRALSKQLLWCTTFRHGGARDLARGQDRPRRRVRRGLPARPGRAGRIRVRRLYCARCRRGPWSA